MRITLAEAETLAKSALATMGYGGGDAAIIAAHIMDCELRGLSYGGLARLLSVAERLGPAGASRTPIITLRETAISARLDGGDQIGYLVAEKATTMAIAKAEANGMAVVGANNTWYTGMLSYYAERAVAKDLVVFIASNATPWVAPQGGSEGRFGTNPICYGFPSAEAPVIWDIGTSAIIHAEVTLAGRLGQRLKPGLAFDPAGEPTLDPAAALAGAFAPWGGHRGSGLGLVVQMLGMLAGSPMMPEHLRDFGYLIIALRPDLLTDLDDYKAGIAEYARTVRATRPVAGGPPVRMPFERSLADREARRAAGTVDVADEIYQALSRLSGRNA